MSLPRELVREVRKLDVPELRRLLILARGLLIGAPGPITEPEDIPAFPAVSYRQQRVRCGRDCGECPHGPYWYAFWREDGRTRSQYIGNALPADVARLLDDVAACD